MSENKRLLARYDLAVQAYARLLTAAIGGEDQADIGYDLIAAAVTVDQTRDLALPFAEPWMLEYIAVATNMLRSLAALAGGGSAGDSSTAARNVASYEALRARFFVPDDFAFHS